MKINLIKGKRAMEPVSIVLIIIGVIVAIFLADKVGLFTISIPNIGQPNGTNSLVNPIYYETTTGNYVCVKNIQAIFRSTFDYNGIDFTGTQYIAYSISFGAALTNHYRLGSSSTSQSGSCNSNHGSPIKTFGNFKIYSSNICYDRIDGKHDERVLDPPLGSTLSTSASPGQGPYEVTSEEDIKDSGKYLCFNGNVYLQYCGSFGSVIAQDCDPVAPCQPISNYLTQDGQKNIVKCSKDYKADQKLCVGNTLYSTNTTGNLLPSKSCYSCQNGICYECTGSEKRCAQLPTTTTSIEICQGGFWAQWNDLSATCINEQFCNLGACTSDVFPGKKRCGGINGKQPQIVNSLYAWVDDNNGVPCNIACIENTTTSVYCENACTPIGNQCSGGIMYQCLSTAGGNNLSKVGNCFSGPGQSFCKDSSHCGNIHNSTDKYCSGKDLFVAGLSGDEYDLFGGITGSLSQTCQTACEVVNGTSKCKKEVGCEGHEGGTICINNTKAKCSENGEYYESTSDCTTSAGGYVNGYCLSQNNVASCQPPAAQCSGSKFCTITNLTSGVIRNCNSGIIGNISDSCNNLGCYIDSTNNPQCNNECPTADARSCKDGDSYICFLNQTNQQKILKLNEDCGTQTCVNGNCNYECSGNSTCKSDGYIHSCSDHLSGGIIDYCNNEGCNSITNHCTDKCTTEGFRCFGQNSIQCFKNLTNNQYLEKTLTCGTEGCNPSNNQCRVSGLPNNYTCGPLGIVATDQAVYRTDSNGYLTSEVSEDCQVEQPRNNLDPFCLPMTDNNKAYTFSRCVVCLYNEEPRCYGNTYAKCANMFTGEIKQGSEKNCQIECTKNGGTFVCDDLIFSTDETQNFRVNDNVLITGKVTRSQSLKGYQTTCTYQVHGESGKQNCNSGSDGSLSISLGTKQLGSYIVNITFDKFNISKLITARVTNDVDIKVVESILLKIPGTTPTATINAEDANHNPPDSINLKTQPANVSVTLTPTGISKQWALTITGGDTGKYSFGFEAISNGVPQLEQFKTIEIRKPQLTISSNLAKTAKPGKTTYDVKVSGPTSSSTSAGIEPDAISATIARSTAQPVSLKKLGSGTYTFEYDFSDTGTYTLEVQATYAGYDSFPFSQSIQISDSGKDVVPGGGGDGGTTTKCTSDLDCKNGQKCSGGVCVSNQVNYSTYLIIGAIIVIGYLIFTRRK